MTEVHGISHYPKEVQEFIRLQFSVRGTLADLHFRRAADGVQFDVTRVVPADACPDVYLNGSKVCANSVSFEGGGAVKTEKDIYKLHFSPGNPAKSATPLIRTAEELTLRMEEIDVPLPPPSATIKKTGGTWNGYPMCSEINPRDALYAVCTLDEVRLHGVKLVLKNGEWHRPK